MSGIVIRSSVSSDMVDELDHMNFLKYQEQADLATLAFWTGVAEGVVAPSFVTLETHVRYLSELRLGEEFEVRPMLLAHDEKRFILRNEIFASSRVAALVDILCIAFDRQSRRSSLFPASIVERLKAALAQTGDAPSPPTRLRLKA